MSVAIQRKEWYESGKLGIGIRYEEASPAYNFVCYFKRPGLNTANMGIDAIESVEKLRNYLTIECLNYQALDNFLKLFNTKN